MGLAQGRPLAYLSKMPKKTEAELAALVDDGSIVGFTLDTTEFHHLGYNYESKSLKALEQFEGTDIALIFSEVVLSEVCAQVRDDIKSKAEKARSSLRQFLNATRLAHDLDQVVANLGIAEDPRKRSKELLDVYIASVKAIVLQVEEGASVRMLHDLYFASEPPFSVKVDKKNEFPDAIALLTLEHWAEARGSYVLAVSNDGDWARFAERSDHLICMPQLSAALNLFNRNDGVVAARLAANLGSDTAQKLRALIQNRLDAMLEIIEVEANAPYFYDVDDAYGEVNNWEIEEDRFDVLASDEENVTVAFTVAAAATFCASFTFSMRDGIDKDYVTIGGTQAEKQEKFSVPIVVTMARDDDGNDPDVLDIEVEGVSISVDFGYVEVDYGEQDEDW